MALKPESTSRPALPPYILNEPWIFQHDSYWESQAVEISLFGLVLLVILLVGGITYGMEAWRANSDPTIKALLALAAAAGLLTLVLNLTNEAFRTPEAAGYIWFLLSAPIAYRNGPRVTAPTLHV